MRFAGCLTMICIAAAIAGCSKPPATSGCEWTRPFFWSPAQGAFLKTAAGRSLLEQLVVHNETGEALCGWQPPGER